MTALSLDLFAAAADPEAARYRVLSSLQQARRQFQRYRVYPHLGHLADVHAGLRALLSNADRVERSGAGPAIGVDWDEGRIVHAQPAAPLGVDLARWALPLVEETVEEGRALYEFAAAHAELAAVGLVPPYRAEGYLVFRADDAIRALRYRISALTGRDGRYRSLETSPVEVVHDPLVTPQAWKTTLAASAPDLPSPATFRLDADLDLPVDETLLPVAKRKLLGLVQSWGEA